MKGASKLYFLIWAGILLFATACSPTAGSGPQETAASQSGMMGDHEMGDSSEMDDAHDMDDAHELDEDHALAPPHSHDKQSADHMTTDDHMDTDDHGSMAMDHMHVPAPAEFADLSNPYAGDLEAIAAGQITYQTFCAVCHGPEGKGDGVAAAGLDPQPASLSDRAMMMELSDGYLYWRITHGGQDPPFESAMPAWEDGLGEEKIWQVIAYLRTLED